MLPAHAVRPCRTARTPTAVFVVLVLALACGPASVTAIACPSEFDATYNVTWPLTLSGLTASLACSTGDGSLLRVCCGTTALGYVDPSGVTCTLAIFDTFMTVADECETASSTLLEELANATITADGAANASLTLQQAINELGDSPRAADLTAALRASTSILSALDLQFAPNITTETITTWLTVKDAISLVLGATTTEVRAGSRNVLLQEGYADSLRQAAPDPVINLAALIVDTFRFVSRLTTELDPLTLFQLGTYNASVIAHTAGAVTLNVSETLEVGLPAELLEYGIISAFFFNLDAQARGNTSDVPAFPAIDMSVTPYNSSLDADALAHATLPSTFDMRFNATMRYSAMATSGDVLALAVSVLNVDYADVLSAALVDANASAIGAVPFLRIALRNNTAYATDAGAVVESEDGATVQVRVALQLQCRWWDGDFWATRGCVTDVQADGSVVCRCDHMTSFAVFMTGAGGTPIDAQNAAALRAITYAGGAISLACLLATAVLFFFNRNKQWVEAHQLIIANLALALAGVHVCFILAVDDSIIASPLGCQTVAILLHFFLLASFAWMAVEGVNLYKSFVRVMDGHKLGDHGGIFRLALLAWGFATGVVAACAGSMPDSYGTADYCWIDVSSIAIYAFIAPIAALCIFNLGVLILVARTLHQNVESKAAFKAAFAFFWLMGLGWAFGLLLLLHDHLVWRYLFSICIALQGIFIFVTQCLNNRRVRSALKGELAPSSSRRTQSSTSGGSGSNGAWKRLSSMSPFARGSRAAKPKSASRSGASVSRATSPDLNSSTPRGGLGASRMSTCSSTSTGLNLNSSLSAGSYISVAEPRTSIPHEGKRFRVRLGSTANQTRERTEAAETRAAASRPTSRPTSRGEARSVGSSARSSLVGLSHLPPRMPPLPPPASPCREAEHRARMLAEAAVIDTNRQARPRQLYNVKEEALAEAIPGSRRGSLV